MSVLPQSQPQTMEDVIVQNIVASRNKNATFVQAKNEDVEGRNRLHFTLKDTNVGYANTLRRLIITGVETIGFRADMKNDGTTSDVNVIKNSTPMTNEMLAHRIGLIPVHVKDPLEFDPSEFKFVLHKTNPTQEPMDVKASDFEVYEKMGSEWEKISTSKFFPPNPITNDTCLITCLKPKMGDNIEEVHVECVASLGNGRENARFIPTCECAYGYSRDDDADKIRKAFESWCSRYKKIDASSLESDPEKKDVLLREFNTLEIQRVYKVDENGEPNSFDFRIESVGILDPKYILYRACKVGSDLFARFGDGDEENEGLPEEVYVRPADSEMTGFDFLILRQDHTLGNAIQTWLDLHLIDPNGNIYYAGYKIPHPLKDEMILRIGVRDNSQSTAIRVFKQAARALSNMFTSWAKLWEPYVTIRNNSNTNSNTNSNESSNSPVAVQTKENYSSNESSSNESTATPTPPPAPVPVKKTASRPSIFAKLAKESKTKNKE